MSERKPHPAFQMAFNALRMPPPNFHTDDPESSKIAAREMDTGKRLSQAQRVLKAVRDWPDRTADELAEGMTLNRYQIARRLSDMRDTLVVRGECRKCRVTGRVQATWRVK